VTHARQFGPVTGGPSSRRQRDPKPLPHQGSHPPAAVRTAVLAAVKKTSALASAEPTMRSAAASPPIARRKSSCGSSPPLRSRSGRGPGGARRRRGGYCRSKVLLVSPTTIRSSSASTSASRISAARRAGRGAAATAMGPPRSFRQALDHATICEASQRHRRLDREPKRLGVARLPAVNVDRSSAARPPCDRR